jgi:hypothetical protein
LGITIVGRCSSRTGLSSDGRVGRVAFHAATAMVNIGLGHARNNEDISPSESASPMRFLPFIVSSNTVRTKPAAISPMSANPYMMMLGAAASPKVSAEMPKRATSEEEDSLGRPSGEDEPMLRSCCMVTAEANGLVSQAHNRMPVILEMGTEKRWLGGSPADAKSLLVPYDEGKMGMFEVGSKVNSSKNDSKDVMERKTTKGTLLDY